MKTATRHGRTRSGQSSRRATGFALIELLLVIALLLVVSMICLRSVAAQGDAVREIDAEVSSVEEKVAAEWIPVEMPQGGRAWLRKI